MKRYHKLLAGASWMAEYGDPDKPEEWAFIQTFSPVPERARRTRSYPPRAVHHLDARRPRAPRPRAQDGGADAASRATTCCYYENIEGGHGGAANNEQAAHMNALAYTFLWNELSK